MLTQEEVKELVLSDIIKLQQLRAGIIRRLDEADCHRQDNKILVDNTNRILPVLENAIFVAQNYLTILRFSPAEVDHVFLYKNYLNPEAIRLKSGLMVYYNNTQNSKIPADFVVMPDYTVVRNGTI